MFPKIGNCVSVRGNVAHVCEVSDGKWPEVYEESEYFFWSSLDLWDNIITREPLVFESPERSYGPPKFKNHCSK